MSQIENARGAFEKHLVAMAEQRSKFSAKGYEEQVASFVNTDAVLAVSAVLAKVSDQTDAARANVAKIRRDISPDLDTAGELRASRAWDRATRLLDSADDGKVTETARALLAKAEGVELGTLVKELGPYLESRRQDSSGWLDSAIAQIVPQLATANDTLRKAEQAQQIIQHNVDRLAVAFKQGSQPAPLVDARAYDPHTA